MNRLGLIGMLVALTALIAELRAQAPPEMPAPQKEHQWLQQLAGEWDVESEAFMAPDQPPIKCKGTERARTLGGFWVVSEGESDLMGMKMQSVLTVGYDVGRKKYVGTWIDSMTGHLWKYEGTLDSAGKVLTLEAEGPSFTAPDKTAKYRDAISVEGKDHKVLTSSVQGEDGKWTTFMTAHYRRSK